MSRRRKICLKALDKGTLTEDLKCAVPFDASIVALTPGTSESDGSKPTLVPIPVCRRKKREPRHPRLYVLKEPSKSQETLDKTCKPPFGASEETVCLEGDTLSEEVSQDDISSIDIWHERFPSLESQAFLSLEPSDCEEIWPAKDFSIEQPIASIRRPLTECPLCFPPVQPAPKQPTCSCTLKQPPPEQAICCTLCRPAPENIVCSARQLQPEQPICTSARPTVQDQLVCTERQHFQKQQHYVGSKEPQTATTETQTACPFKDIPPITIICPHHLDKPGMQQYDLEKIVSNFVDKGIQCHQDYNQYASQKCTCTTCTCTCTSKTKEDAPCTCVTCTCTCVTCSRMRQQQEEPCTCGRDYPTKKQLIKIQNIKWLHCDDKETQFPSRSNVRKSAQFSSKSRCRPSIALKNVADIGVQCSEFLVRKRSSTSALRVEECPVPSDYRVPECPSSSDYRVPECPSASDYSVPECAGPSNYRVPECPSLSNYRVPECPSLSNYKVPECPSASDYRFPEYDSTSDYKAPECLKKQKLTVKERFQMECEGVVGRKSRRKPASQEDKGIQVSDCEELARGLKTCSRGTRRVAGKGYEPFRPIAYQELCDSDASSSSESAVTYDENEDDSGENAATPDSRPCRAICEEAYNFAQKIMEAKFPLPLIIFELPSNIPPQTLEWLISKILLKEKRGGAEMTVLLGFPRNCQITFLGINASVCRLALAAQRAGMVKWTTCKQLMTLNPETIGCFIENEDLETALTTPERQWLVYREVMGIPAFADENFIPGMEHVQLFTGQSIVLKCQEEKLVKQILPLHETLEKTQIANAVRWLYCWWKVDLIACYFGPSTAIFFGILLLYFYVLIPPTVVALLALLLVVKPAENEENFQKWAAQIGFAFNRDREKILDSVTVIHAIVNIMTVILFILITKWIVNKMTVQWAAFTIGCGDNRPRRTPSAYGQYSNYEWNDFFKEFCISLPLTFVAATLVALLMLSGIQVAFIRTPTDNDKEEEANNNNNDDDSDNKGRKAKAGPSTELSILLMFGILLYFALKLFVKIARGLTDWEDHLLYSQYNRSLVAKITLFIVIACFVPVFFVIMQNRLDVANKYVFAVVLVFILLDLLYDILLSTIRGHRHLTESLSGREAENPIENLPIYSFLEKKISTVPKLPRTDPIVEESEAQIKLLPFKDMMKDFAVMYANMGFIFMYSAISPLSCIVTFVYVLFLLPVKIHRLCTVQQRPLAFKTLSVVGWQNALDLLLVLALFTNCLLLSMSAFLHGRLGANITDFQWFIVFLLLALFLFIIAFAITFSAPSATSAAEAAYAQDQRDCRTASHMEMKRRRDEEARKHSTMREKDSFKLSRHPRENFDECEDDNDEVDRDGYESEKDTEPTPIPEEGKHRKEKKLKQRKMMEAARYCQPGPCPMHNPSRLHHTADHLGHHHHEEEEACAQTSSVAVEALEPDIGVEHAEKVEEPPQSAVAMEEKEERKKRKKKLEKKRKKKVRESLGLQNDEAPEMVNYKVIEPTEQTSDSEPEACSSGIRSRMTRVLNLKRKRRKKHLRKTPEPKTIIRVQREPRRKK